MDNWSKVGWSCLLVVINLIFFLGGVHAGRIEGEDRLLNKQVVSAQALADNIVIIQECKMEVKETRDDIDNFTFGVCKGLGLIK